MTREEIIGLAREAGYGLSLSDMHAPGLERFAALVAAAEREACAAICDGNARFWNGYPGYWGLAYSDSAKSSAAKIRARGEK